MSDDPFSRNEGPNRRTPEPQFNWRGFLLLAMAVLLVGSALVVKTSTTGSQEISYREFKTYVEQGLIDPDRNLELIRKDTTTAEVIK
eukprot:gene3044-3786_t